ncbi:hypothetical protein RHECNPAF_2530047 [Rhizobium etli CNPAF512]|nr:hypothetical protein RHECNPAF_2530047 [Rhizobium etli CNPAF512]
MSGQIRSTRPRSRSPTAADAVVAAIVAAERGRPRKPWPGTRRR